MLSKSDLLNEIKGLEAQRDYGARMVQQADGALQLARHLLGLAERREDEAMAKARAEAGEANKPVE